MTIEITMPRLSDTMEEGTLIKWRVKVGDRVANGDVLADIETDKATMELQSFDDGTVARLALEENQAAPVGKLIMELDEATAAEGEDASAVPALSDPPPQSDLGESATSEGRRLRVSPVARRLAEEHGIDLAGITGSGPGGRIIKRDVLEVADPGTTSGPPPVANATPGAGQRVQITAMRRTIARRLVESKTTIPHFTVTVSVDASELVAVRATINQRLADKHVRISLNDFVMRACAVALRDHPGVNASWTDEAIRLHETVDLGLAVALPGPPEGSGGLVVPVIRQADTLTVRQIGAETRRLAEKARVQGLSAEDMSGGTFTVSNLGMFGVDHFEAIINPPEAAILAVGAAASAPVVRDGAVVPGHVMSCTLSADHRVVDGAVAAAFLTTLREFLEAPELILV